MYETCIFITQFFFSVITLQVFVNSILTERKNISPLLYWLGFILLELLGTIPSELLYENRSINKIILMDITNILYAFLPTFYYKNVKFRVRVFIAAMYWAYCSLSEIPCVIFTKYVLSNWISSSSVDNDHFVQLESNLTLFIMVLVTRIIFQKKTGVNSLKYNFSLLITPILSSIIIINIANPFTNTVKNATFQRMLEVITLISVFIINVINFILLDSILKVKKAEEEKARLEQQIAFQSNKYSQISSAYRDTRRIIHDTKKHFFYLEECAKKGTLEDSIAYMKTAVSELENTYSKINTGNIVIDAFVSNHMSVAKQEGITFNTDFRFDVSRVPVKDYHLSIILGNLLDNSLQECRSIIPPKTRYINLQIITTENQFVIHVTNPSSDNHQSKTTIDYQLYHGYGIENVKQITKLYHGTYDIAEEPELFDTIVVIPIWDHMEPKNIPKDLPK